MLKMRGQKMSERERRQLRTLRRRRGQGGKEQQRKRSRLLKRQRVRKRRRQPSKGQQLWQPGRLPNRWSNSRKQMRRQPYRTSWGNSQRVGRLPEQKRKRLVISSCADMVPAAARGGKLFFT